MKCKAITFTAFLYAFLTILTVELSAAGEDGQQVNIKFAAVGFSDTISNLGFYDGSKWIPIEIPEATRSREFEYSGPSTIRFAEMPVPVDGETPVIAEATVTPDIERPLFIFVKAPAGSTRDYRVLVFEDSFSYFTPGSYRLANLTSKNLGLTLGEERVLLESKAIKTIRPDQENRSYFAFKVFALSGNEDHRQLFSSRWFYESNSRMLVFLLNDPRRDLVVLKTVYDKSDPELLGQE